MGRAEAIVRTLPPTPGRAVDLGAGSGWLTELLVKLGWEVTAVEKNPATAQQIARRAPEATVILDEPAGHDLEPLISRADAIFALSFLHHLKDPRAALTAILGTSALVVVETPARSEAQNPKIYGGAQVAVLHDLITARRPHVIAWSQSAFDPAYRALCAWDPNLRAGTVVSGHGHTTREWNQVGAHLETEFGPLHPGSLNLELDEPLDYEQTIRTPAGPVQAVPVLAGGHPAVAVRMPASDRGDLFTELVASSRLRTELSLDDSSILPLRLA